MSPILVRIRERQRDDARAGVVDWLIRCAFLGLLVMILLAVGDPLSKRMGAWAGEPRLPALEARP